MYTQLQKIYMQTSMWLTLYLHKKCTHSILIFYQPILFSVNIWHKPFRELFCCIFFNFKVKFETRFKIIRNGWFDWCAKIILCFATPDKNHTWNRRKISSSTDSPILSLILNSACIDCIDEIRNNMKTTRISYNFKWNNLSCVSFLWILFIYLWLIFKDSVKLTGFLCNLVSNCCS